MFTVDLAQQTNASFNFSFSLTSWADLYDLANGSFYMQMRETAASPIVLYQWDTDGGGGIQYLQTLANGSIVFTQNPAPTEFILIGATYVSFGTTPMQQVDIDGDLAHTMANMLAYLQQSADPQLIQCTYTVTGTALNILYKTAGTLGNEFALVSSVSGATASGATLSGGGGVLSITAPVGDIENFAGAYVYDCRYESGATVVPLFGGTITFTQGVTRDVP